MRLVTPLWLALKGALARRLGEQTVPLTFRSEPSARCSSESRAGRLQGHLL